MTGATIQNKHKQERRKMTACGLRTAHRLIWPLAPSLRAAAMATTPRPLGRRSRKRSAERTFAPSHFIVGLGRTYGGPIFIGHRRRGAPRRRWSEHRPRCAGTPPASRGNLRDKGKGQGPSRGSHTGDDLRRGGKSSGRPKGRSGDIIRRRGTSRRQESQQLLHQAGAPRGAPLSTWGNLRREGSGQRPAPGGQAKDDH